MELSVVLAMGGVVAAIAGSNLSETMRKGRADSEASSVEMGIDAARELANGLGTCVEYRVLNQISSTIRVWDSCVSDDSKVREERLYNFRYLRLPLAGFTSPDGRLVFGPEGEVSDKRPSEKPSGGMMDMTMAMASMAMMGGNGPPPPAPPELPQSGVKLAYKYGLGTKVTKRELFVYPASGGVEMLKETKVVVSQPLEEQPVSTVTSTVSAETTTTSTSSATLSM